MDTTTKTVLAKDYIARTFPDNAYGDLLRKVLFRCSATNWSDAYGEIRRCCPELNEDLVVGDTHFRTGIEPHQFSEASVYNVDWTDSYRCWFECAMISTCDPLLNDCDDNYEVREKLKKAGVMNGTCDDDSESSALVMRFKTRKSGLAFIGRLNKFLVERAKKLDMTGSL